MTDVTWLRINTADAPTPRIYQSVAYDTDNNLTYLWDGYEGATSQYKGGTWSFDGTNWTLLSPTVSPPVTDPVTPFYVSRGMVYDEARAEVVSAGVEVAGGFQTWTYDTTTWLLKSPATSPPNTHINFAIVYDAARSNTVIFGGKDSGVPSSDTWTWDGTTWTQEAPASSPDGGEYCAIGFDPSRNVVVVLDYSGDTWEWDGTNWTLAVAYVGPPTTPTAGLSYTNLGWCSFLGELVLFGGATGAGAVVYGDTWSYDGVAWTLLAPAASPPQRETPQQTTVSPVQDTVMIFGGEDVTTFYDDTWILVPSVTPTGGTPYLDADFSTI